jgi:hypothetical protein
MYCCLAIAVPNIASGNIFTNDLSGNRPPRNNTGAAVFLLLGLAGAA